MSWETTGTVAVTNNSSTVTGTGTLFAERCRVGDAFNGPDGSFYEVINIASNTLLSISPAYKGVTGTGKIYQVVPVRGYSKKAADYLHELLRKVGPAIDNAIALPDWITVGQPTPIEQGGTGATDSTAARNNLGVNSKAEDATALSLKVDKTDSRLTDSREWTAGTIPQAEVEAGTATTRRAFTSQRLRQGITAWFTGISGAIGRTILGRSTAAEVRGDLGLGTAATRDALDAPSSGNLSLLLTGNSYGIGGTTLDDERTPEGFARSLRTKKFAMAAEGHEVPPGVPSGIAIGTGGSVFSSNYSGVYAALNERRAFVYNLPAGVTEPVYAEMFTTENQLNIGTTPDSARSALGLGTAATRNVGTVQGDVLPVGAYGIADFPTSMPTALEASSNGIIWSTSSSADAVQCGVSISPLELTAGKFGIGFNVSSEEGYLTVNNGASLSTRKIITSSNISSSTGQSTEYPMSQKATTDALNLKANSSSLGTAATLNVGTDAGQVLTVGARGLGVVSSPTSPGFEGFKESFYSTAFTSGVSGNHFPSNWPTGYVWSTGANEMSASSSGLVMSNTGNRIGFFTGFGTTSTELPPLMEIYHSGNTTKNPDGTLKASSPVINLYTDKHDLHNEEQFGATPTVVRKSKGVYEITGTLGLRSEGWYLDTPSDRNGNKYFNIEWTQNITPDAAGGVVDEYRNDIVVTVETFERVWNKETGLFENGSPIDINDFQDRFVQLRFNEIKQELPVLSPAQEEPPVDESEVEVEPEA